MLETIKFPEPVIDIAIEPKTKADQDKMGMALAAAGRGRPDLPRAHRPGDRPDDHLRHGRAAPRSHRRPACCASSGWTPTSAGRRWPTARRSPAPCQGRGALRAPDRRARPVRPRRGSRSSRWSRAPGFEFENKTVGGSVPREYVRPSRPGVKEAHGERRRRRLPDGRHPGARWSMARTTRWTRPKWRSRWPARWASSEAARRGGPSAAGAGDEGRGDDAGGFPRRRDRRPERAARPDRGHGAARATRRSSGPWCRWRRCSATPPTCARMTQGRATYSMEFEHYEPVSAAVAEECWPRRALGGTPA